ncbi:TetR family transcriptional regulator [Saccharopolyspora cebuensis]|uniref:TetR family transcriptional regulator n=1 Tax=Saccharopolyspora cebuensis TaxID=418759 RepID=A0ABV4CAE1_9PSEU
MSESPTPKPRAGRTAQGRRRVRGELALAALDLFAEQGFEATTVDHIAEAAGISRRTFFRYFRSKEDVVFPSHDERLGEVVDLLDGADPTADPLRVLAGTAEVVLDMYLAEPAVSLKRFALTRQVPSLRDKEITSIDRYQRVFARFLRARYADRPGGELHAAVAAAAVVAAHNHVLRQWLKSGGAFDAKAELRTALDSVQAALSAPRPAGEGNVVVGVLRTAAPTDAVLAQLEHALRDLPQH